MSKTSTRYPAMMEIKRTTGIRDLYPDLKDGQLLEAEQNIDRYLKLTLRIVERLESEASQANSHKQPNTLTSGTGTL